MEGVRFLQARLQVVHYDMRFDYDKVDVKSSFKVPRRAKCTGAAWHGASGIFCAKISVVTSLIFTNTLS